jgi:F0F1-type ATP synthase delta subunit
MALPVLAATPTDIGRLQLELAAIDEALLQAGIRKGGELKMPHTSRLMDQLIEVNRLTLLHDQDRIALKEFLADIKEKAPVIHMSFSADPTPRFTQKLVTWLRKEIHPSLLLTIGLQPTIGAGCIVRTTNKQFDFSLREDFKKKRDLLRSQLSKAPEVAAAETGKAPS